MSKPKLLVIGHARHGKDTVCELLKQGYGFKFTSSSMFCAARVVFPALGPIYGYKTAEECFHDRANHRAEWYRIISDFNKPDPTRLGRAIFAENDVYCGLRHKAEFHALRNADVFDHAIWVDRSTCVPPEPTDSMTLEPWMADFVLDNNGDLTDLRNNLAPLVSTLKSRYIGGW